MFNVQACLSLISFHEKKTTTVFIIHFKITRLNEHGRSPDSVTYLFQNNINIRTLKLLSYTLLYWLARLDCTIYTCIYCVDSSWPIFIIY